MTNRKQDTTAANRNPASAESIIEDRAPALDGNEIDVSDLQQPDLDDDRNAVETIFTGFEAAFTDERNFVNPKSGQPDVANDRRRILAIVTNNFMQQLDYALKTQLAEVSRRESHVAAVKDGKSGDEDNSGVANAEAWLEREQETFMSLVEMRKHARNEFAKLRGFRYEEQDRKPAAKTKTAQLAAMLHS